MRGRFHSSPLCQTPSGSKSSMQELLPPQNVRKNTRHPPYVVTWDIPVSHAGLLKGYVLYIGKGDTLSTTPRGFFIRQVFLSPLLTSLDVSMWIKWLVAPSFTVGLTSLDQNDIESQLSNTVTFYQETLPCVSEINIDVIRLKGQAGMMLTWDAVPGAVEYKVYVAQHYLDSRNLVGRVTGTQSMFFYAPIETGTSYELVITSVSGVGIESAWPPQEKYHRVTPVFAPPAVDSNSFKFQLSPDTSFTLLSWAPVPRAYSYKVYVKQMRTKLTPVVSIKDYDFLVAPVNDQTFAKLDLVLGMPYTIAVIAEDICGTPGKLSEAVEVRMRLE